MPTNTERLDQLTERVVRLEARFDERSAYLEGTSREQAVRQQALADELFRLGQRVAAADQRCDNLQRLSDRGWTFAQAVLISVFSLLAGAVVTLVVRR